MRAKAFAIIPQSKNKATEIELVIEPLVMCCYCEYFDGENCCMKHGLIVPEGGKWFCADGEQK